MGKSQPNDTNSYIDPRLAHLLDEVCDGSASSEAIAELERLASVSTSARRYVVHYLQLHGELLWAHGRLGKPGHGAQPESPVVPAASARRLPELTSGRRRLRSLFAVVVAYAASVVIFGLFFARLFVPAGPEQAPKAVQVAKVVEACDAEWGDQESPTEFFAGTSARLESGYVQLEMKSGVTLILEAPADVCFSEENDLHVQSGRLSACVPKRAAGFKITTPAATVVDLGTEFGVTVREKDACEVCVFAGKVEISDPRSSDVKDAQPPRQVIAGEAVRVVRGEGRLAFSELLRRGACYVRRLPPPREFAFRQAAARHPALIHHFPFEGCGDPERRRDRRGSLDLLETVMLGGRGSGSLAWSVDGVQPVTRAVEIRRSRTSPNKEGTALQSERAFVPPGRMTIELLLRFDGFETPEEGAVATAVASRTDASDCGFYVAVVEDGQLAHLLDGDADWLETGYVLKPRVWHYVAVTFETLGENQTRINTYIADLSQSTPKLAHPLKDQVVVGTPAVGRLGIGKGFDETRAHAYPFSGALDEVGVYNEVMDKSAVEERLRLLCAKE